MTWRWVGPEMTVKHGEEHVPLPCCRQVREVLRGSERGEGSSRCVCGVGVFGCGALTGHELGGALGSSLAIQLSADGDGVLLTGCQTSLGEGGQMVLHGGSDLVAVLLQVDTPQQVIDQVQESDLLNSQVTLIQLHLFFFKN